MNRLAANMFRTILLGVLVICSLVSAQLEPQPLFRFNERLSEVPESRVVTNYRLPNNTRPSHYDVELWTRVDQQEFDFQGTVSITLNALEATNNITVHTRQLTIEEVSVRLSTSQSVISEVTFEEDTDAEFLVVNVPSGLAAGAEYVLFVNFSGELRQDDAGFYRSSYINATGDRVYVS